MCATGLYKQFRFRHVMTSLGVVGKNVTVEYLLSVVLGYDVLAE